MTAHATPGRFVISFWRDAEILDAHVVSTPDQALQMAHLMLNEAHPLQHGDKLDVVEDHGEHGLPEASRTSHHSG